MQGDSDDDMEDEDELVSDDAMEMDDDDEDLALDPIDATEPGRGDASSSTSAQEYNGIGESCHPYLYVGFLFSCLGICHIIQWFSLTSCDLVAFGVLQSWIISTLTCRRQLLFYDKRE